MKGSKPRLSKEPPTGGNGEHPLSENQKLDRIYKQHRNTLLDLKIKDQALTMALRRNELIERELVLKQLAFILVGFRSKLMAFPHHLAARFEAANRPRVHRIAEKVVHELLEELANIPDVIEPDWMERLEEEEEKG